MLEYLHFLQLAIKLHIHQMLVAPVSASYLHILPQPLWSLGIVNNNYCVICKSSGYCFLKHNISKKEGR